MIVEDEQDTRELLQELLESRGYQVATAQDGVEAMELMNRSPAICMVLVDLMMPRMNGFEVLNAMAADPRLSGLPVCVSTSAPERAPNGIPCLPKPVDIERLFAMVSQNCRASV